MEHARHAASGVLGSGRCSLGGGRVLTKRHGSTVGLGNSTGLFWGDARTMGKHSEGLDRVEVGRRNFLDHAITLEVGRGKLHVYAITRKVG